MTQRSSLLTFLIADIRDYTRFTFERGDEAAALLATRFSNIAAGVIEAHCGHNIELRGDEVLCAFESARNGLRAAVALQAEFKRAARGDPLFPLGVGIGLDAGEVVPVRQGYRGGALNLAARLCSIAGPGDIFASETVIGLARKTEGLSFINRGTVTLKGLTTPVTVIQIAANDEIPANLPPLQAILVSAHPNNLPDEPTPFIGRGHDIDALCSVLRRPSVRLVTMTGPGGTGKTRLALQVGTALLGDFEDGVFFVSLAVLTDPALVPSAIAEVLGNRQVSGDDVLAALTGHLRQKQLLLVLDNFEHLLSASATVASLLDSCRGLRIVVTSRMPLHLTRENEYAVSPLAVPDAASMRTPEVLSQYESVALFIDRARAAKSDFVITNENAPAVAEICSRLDGLPLAIELAAARTKIFPPSALLQRLSSRLNILTGGAKDRPSRQQTLRGAIDWSYSLLSEVERTLFARFSVFSGGCTFEAAEVVCNPDMNLDLLDGITSLVDKSLVRQEGDDEPRFFMLETIREYAGEILDACADRESTCRRHAQYIAALTESADRQLEGPDQLPWLDRLGAEHGNIRAAVNWARANDVGIALQILGSTARYAQIRGHAAEARAWFADILPLEGAEPAVRARALLAGSAFDWGTGEARIQEALNLSRDTRDLHGISSALARLAYRRAYEDRCNEARRLAEEGLAAARATHDPQTIDFALSGLAQVALWQGDRQTARELYEGILERDRSAQNSRKVAIDLIMLAHVAALDDDGNLVVHLAQEADEIHHELGDQSGVATAQLFWALGQILSGRFAEAEDRARRSLTLESNLGTRDCSPMLDALVVTASAKGHARRSAMLCGAAERMRRVEGMPLPAAVRERYRPFIEEVRRVLGDDAFDTAYRAGQALSQTEAIDLALGHGTSVE